VKRNVEATHPLREPLRFLVNGGNRVQTSTRGVAVGVRRLGSACSCGNWRIMQDDGLLAEWPPSQTRPSSALNSTKVIVRDFDQFNLAPQTPSAGPQRRSHQFVDRIVHAVLFSMRVVAEILPVLTSGCPDCRRPSLSRPLKSKDSVLKSAFSLRALFSSS
jgi:hypothetical protein